MNFIELVPERAKVGMLLEGLSIYPDRQAIIYIRNGKEGHRIAEKIYVKIQRRCLVLHEKTGHNAIVKGMEKFTAGALDVLLVDEQALSRIKGNLTCRNCLLINCDFPEQLDWAEAMKNLDGISYTFISEHQEWTAFSAISLLCRRGQACNISPQILECKR